MLTIDDIHCKEHAIQAQDLYDSGQLSDEEIVELSEAGIIQAQESEVKEAKERLGIT